MNLLIKNEKLILTVEGAVYWPAHKALFVADTHIGKVMHFRKNGIALPAEVRFAFYEKIDTLLKQFTVKTLYFLGDLFHSDYNTEWDYFENWSNQQSFDKVLIQGNHDILPPSLFERAGITVFSKRECPPFVLTHHPLKNTTPLVNLCGHIHPGIRLKGIGGQSLKTSCFYQKPYQLILPAFGDFTGNYLIKPKAEEQVYALGETQVIPIDKMRK